MDYRILGPLEVFDERGAVGLGGTKPRVVLAVLLLHANRAVSAEQLAMALWGDDAPPGAVKTVRVHVSRLRKALGDPDLLETTPAGYRLRVRADELDAERFEHTVEAGRRALAAGEPEDAAVLLRRALELWRGSALGELDGEPFMAEIARLEEQRLEALEARIEADLAAGKHAAVVSELRQLVAEHPRRERLAGALMLALYRGGRQADALDAYREARRVLVDELGIEPGRELQRLHAAVLAQDPELDHQAADPDLPAALDASAMPRLVGRGAELTRLRERRLAARHGSGSVVVLCGTEGIGKTRLAAELATEAHRDGDVVRLLPSRGPRPQVRGTLAALGESARPTLAVVEDADAAAGAFRGLAEAVARAPVLVVACARDADALHDAGAHDVLVLGPLSAEAVRSLAADSGVPPAWLLEAGGGVPRRLHELARRWTQMEAARRVDEAAGRTAAGREQLRSLEAELAGGVIDLQAAQEDAPVAGEDGAVPCPFKGLASFDVADAPYFFGRERLVAELVARLIGASVLGVVGPSGSGKSSVVRAGLLPALADGVLPGSAGWARALMRPGEHPLRELERVTAGVAQDRRVVLVVDQFEETFTVCRDEAERRAFIARLTAAGDRVVVVGIRADDYGRCGAYPELARALAAHHVLVGAMRREELRRAVERPAERAGLHVEPGLVDTIVSDVEHEPGALPTLSTALLSLWQRRDGRELRLATYEASGGVRGAIARHAEEAFAQLDREQQAVARSVLLRLAAEGAGGATERRRVALGELDAARDETVREVVAVLTDQRLLTVSAGAVELAHEALLREWPRLRGWLEDDTEGRRLHRRLAGAARDWDDSGRDTGDLYRGARLAGALEWRARHEPDLNRSERAFLEESRGGEERERRVASVRRRRAVGSAVAVLVVLAAVFTTLGVRAVRHARFEQRAAASRALATQAMTHLDDDVALAGLLGLEAYRIQPTVDAHDAVLSVLPALGGYRRIGSPLQDGGPVNSVAITADGRTLASGGEDGMVRMWDMAAHRPLGSWDSHQGTVNEVAFSPDGRLLAAAGSDGTVRLWDVAERRPWGRPLRQGTKTAWGVAFSPDGKTLASVGDDGVSAHGGLRLWDVASGRAIGRMVHTPGYNTDVAFSPDGKLLATAENGVRLWDVATLRPLTKELPSTGFTVWRVAFSPDGRTVAGSFDDGRVRLWNVRTRRAIGPPLTGSAGDVHSLAFSPDGAMIASGHQNGTVRLWNARTHRLRALFVTDANRPPGRSSANQEDDVMGLAFSPRSGILASGDVAGEIQLWSVVPRDQGHPLSRPLPGHHGWIRGAAFTSADTLVTGGLDRSLRVWNTRSSRPVGLPVPVGQAVLGLAASPDGRTLAIAGAKLRLWDARTRGPLGQLTGHAGTVDAVAFSPDGGTLASGGADGTVRLWDPASRTQRGPPLDAGGSAVKAVAFGQGGRILAAGDQDGTVRLWDVGRRRLLGPPLHGGPGFVGAVAFSPDGKILASAGGDRAIWLWDVAAHRALRAPLRGHTDVIDALSFSPDGTTLASAGADHTVRLWDVPTGRALGRPLRGHTGWVSALAFSPHGDELASAGEDQTVRLWDPILWSHDRDALEARVCDVIGHSLTRAQWAAFIPDRPYRPTCPRAS